MLFLLGLLACLAGAQGFEQLFTFSSLTNTSQIPDCQEENLISCKRIDINFDAYKDCKNLTILGVNFILEKATNGTNHMSSKSYQSAQMTSTMLTYSSADGYDELDGTVSMPDGDLYNIDNCGRGCHILTQSNTSNIIGDGGEVDKDMARAFTFGKLEGATQRLLDRGSSDRLTVVTASVAVYYTSAYARVTGNPILQITNLINVANEGYRRTSIPVRLCASSILRLNIREHFSSNQRLRDFAFSRGSFSALLNRADFAILVTATQARDAGGQVLAIEPISQRILPVGWAWKQIPLIFAHEVGHIFGCRHDRRNDPTNTFAHGWLIRNTPFYTVMAYRFAPRWTRWINLYSNTIFTINGNAMGDRFNDNRRKFIQTRFSVANNGPRSLKRAERMTEEDFLTAPLGLELVKDV